MRINNLASYISCALVWAYCGSFAVQAQTAQSAGTIRGRVTVPSVDELTEEILRGRALMRYQEHGARVESTGEAYRLAEKAVVYLESLSDESVPAPPDLHPRLYQTQMMFHPLVLPVLAGTTVDFPNDDNLYHNVFSYSQPKVFDLGRYPQGQSRSVVFDKPGVVKVYCDIHSYMYATVLVLQNPYFALPEDDGSYTIKDVPPGNYHLTYWYGRKKVSTVPVIVHADQVSVVNFRAVD